MKDLTTKLCMVKRGSGLEEILPFILARQYTKIPNSKFRNWKDYPVWLEWSENCPPTAEDIAKSPKIPQQQTLNDYQLLPYHRFTERQGTFLATADRIIDGEVVFCKVHGGCMWGMIPNDEPKPET